MPLKTRARQDRHVLYQVCVRVGWRSRIFAKLKNDAGVNDGSDDKHVVSLQDNGNMTADTQPSVSCENKLNQPKDQRPTPQAGHSVAIAISQDFKERTA
jgi:hypothetical protein